MAARVQIIVEARDATSGVLRAITSQLGSFGSVIDDLTAKDFSIGNLAQSLTTFAIDGAKKLYELGKAGAQLELVETRFDRLAESIGTTGDILKTDLRDATRGMYSDAELMASATDLMALGLAKTHDEAVRLASVSAGLNMNMNQLVLTLTNQTTMRFDALGVSVDGFKEKVKELEEQGMDTNAAFKEAFLRQAEDQLTRVGHAADTTAGEFMRLEAEWQNMANNMKKGTAEALLPVVSWLNDITGEEMAFREALKASNEELFNKYMATQLATPEMKKLVSEYREAEENAKAWRDAMKDTTPVLEEQIETAKELEERIKAISEENKLWVNTISDVGGILEDYQDAQDKANQELAEGKITAEEHAAAMNQLSAEYEAAKNKIVLSIVEMKLAADGWTDAELGAYLRIGQSLGVFTDEMVQETNAVLLEADKLVAGFGDLADNTEHAGARAEDAAQKFGGLERAAAELGDVVRTEAVPPVSELKGDLAGLPASGTSWAYYFDISVSGKVPRLPSRDQGGFCFAGGTLVTMADGTRKRIEEIQVGDVVRSYDTDTMEFTDSAVVQTFKHQADGYLNIDGLLVTPEHPLWIYGREWVKAGEVKAGNTLFCDYGGTKQVQHIFRVSENITVYNLEVEGVHTYFAGGVLVHNKEAETFGSQAGGAVYAGNPYTVGEAGAEPFFPAVNGRILGHAESLHAMSLGGGGGNNMYFYGNVTIAAGSETGGDVMSIR